MDQKSRWIICKILLNSSLEGYQILRILPNFHIISKNFTKMLEKFVFELVSKYVYCIHIHYTILESGWCRFGQKWKLIKKESWRQNNWLDENNSPAADAVFRVFRVFRFFIYEPTNIKFIVVNEWTNLIFSRIFLWKGKVG